MLPRFDADGLLPPGDHDLTIGQLKESMLVVGPGPDFPDWDSRWWMRLVCALELLASQLWQVGIPSSICIARAFVEDRNHPNDIEGYFYCDDAEFLSGQLEERLNELDPQKAWNLDPRRRTFDDRGKPRIRSGTGIASICSRISARERAYSMIPATRGTSTP